MLGRRPRRQPCWGDGEVVEPTKRHARTGPRKRVGHAYRIRTQQEGPHRSDQESQEEVTGSTPR
jgi:hypothetical protein